MSQFHRIVTIFKKCHNLFQNCLNLGTPTNVPIVQVFRNCIDKFSHNVHFIASCTNTQKVIDSLQSRMTIIKVKALKLENLIKISKRICKIENIMITPEAEEFVLSICNNSVRILINYLEKFKLLSKEISLNKFLLRNFS